MNSSSFYLQLFLKLVLFSIHENLGGCPMLFCKSSMLQQYAQECDLQCFSVFCTLLCLNPPLKKKEQYLKAYRMMQKVNIKHWGQGHNWTVFIQNTVILWVPSKQLWKDKQKLMFTRQLHGCLSTYAGFVLSLCSSEKGVVVHCPIANIHQLLHRHSGLSQCIARVLSISLFVWNVRSMEMTLNAYLGSQEW